MAEEDANVRKKPHTLTSPGRGTRGRARSVSSLGHPSSPTALSASHSWQKTMRKDWDCVDDKLVQVQQNCSILDEYKDWINNAASQADTLDMPVC